MLNPERFVSAEPSLFCVGATQVIRAVPVAGEAGAETTMEKAGRATDVVPSLTLIVMPESVPASPEPGVPVRFPEAVLNVAHDGLFTMLNANVLPLASLAVGV